MKKLIFLFPAAVAIVLYLLVLPASAEVNFSMTEVRQDLRAAIVKVEGNLVCKMGEVNEGQACDLKFQDVKTGQAFQLSNVNDAMRLYYSGSVKVAVEGTVNGDMIEVKEMRAL